MKNKALKLTAAAASMLMLASCGSASGSMVEKPVMNLTDSTPAAAGELDTLKWSLYAEPYSLDYAYAFDYSDNQVLANICEPLLRLNPDLSVAPGLAAKWENPTPTTWVYTIRKNVKFHDGTTLTPKDVVASLNRHLDPEVGSSWYSAFANVKSIEATGKDQVTITTTKPDALLNESLSGAAGVIESAATLEKLGGDYGNASGGVNCTGPYQLDEWSSGEKLSLSSFDEYWDKDLAPKAKKLDFVVMTDPVARVNALKSGEIDGGWMIPSNAINELQATGTGQMYFGTNSAVSSLVVSNPEGPLGDARVREALVRSIDRNGLVMAAESGYATATDSLTAQGVWGQQPKKVQEAAFDQLNEYPYDLEKAKSLVKEAGAEGREITITTAPMGNNFNVVAQATAAAAESIGLKATIKTVTPNAYTALFSDPAAREGTDLFFTNWYLSVGNPLEMFSIMRTDDFSNYGGFSSPKYDKAVNQALFSEKPEGESKNLLEAQKILNEQLPWLPLYETPTTLWMSDRVTGTDVSVNYLYYPWAAQIGAK
ncbi:ABC transporter substrate-binding protein [Glutamicibacter uratoxydans]|uniref:ABC transporter substrate-binding protein n=1 Tax=Glutamicibacter uratoxydans TaxID=43667 RepID=A0A4Y4DRI2_GLUUR|nr:ABC transporter substrate-binding protein [Glutamicibacter uratoxydans]GED05978.1 ABC transporter substrate-binding protein [Glutamicibacter uratoxydans]